MKGARHLRRSLLALVYGLRVQSGSDCTGYAVVSGWCHHVNFSFAGVFPALGIFRPGLPQSKDRDSLYQRFRNHGSN